MSADAEADSRGGGGGGSGGGGNKSGRKGGGSRARVYQFDEDQLSRRPCVRSTVPGFVCQKAHVNGTLRIHWTPYKKGGANFRLAARQT